MKKLKDDNNCTELAFLVVMVCITFLLNISLLFVEIYVYMF